MRLHSCGHSLVSFLVMAAVLKYVIVFILNLYTIDALRQRNKIYYEYQLMAKREELKEKDKLFGNREEQLSEVCLLF